MPNDLNSASLPPVPSLMVFAIKGVDRISGADVQTVLEARDADGARRIADEKSLDAHEVTLLHPLNGADALRQARADGNDRFNQPAPLVLSADPHLSDASAAEPLHAPPVLEAAAPPPVERRRPEPHAASQPQPVTGPPAFNAVSEAPTPNDRFQFPGTAAAAVLLAGLGAFVYFVGVRGHRLSDLTSGGPRTAAAVTAPVEDLGPTDVDELIAASSNPDTSAPLLPRNQRGPGKSTTRKASAPSIAATPRPASPLGPRPAGDAPAFELSGIVAAGPRRAHAAVINGQIVRAGQSINGHRLLQINDDSVVLEYHGKLIGLGLVANPTAEPTAGR